MLTDPLRAAASPRQASAARPLPRTQSRSAPRIGALVPDPCAALSGPFRFILRPRFKATTLDGADRPRQPCSITRLCPPPSPSLASPAIILSPPHRPPTAPSSRLRECHRTDAVAVLFISLRVLVARQLAWHVAQCSTTLAHAPYLTTAPPRSTILLSTPATQSPTKRVCEPSVSRLPTPASSSAPARRTRPPLPRVRNSNAPEPLVHGFPLASARAGTQYRSPYIPHGQPPRHPASRQPSPLRLSAAALYCPPYAPSPARETTLRTISRHVVPALPGEQRRSPASSIPPTVTPQFLNPCTPLPRSRPPPSSPTPHMSTPMLVSNSFSTA
jgi:hypothetical protein